MGKDAEFFALSQDEQIVSLTHAAAAIPANSGQRETAPTNAYSRC